MNLLKNKKVIFLMGPTACGKTELAINLANRLPVEIINVDSAQIYIGMDIGTNKPSKQQLALTKHHLIDIRLPNQHYSVADFCSDADNLIKSIHAKNKIPLLVGGTMLYFYGLCFGLSDLPSRNLDIRNDILRLAAGSGWEKVYAKLKSIDPMAASNIDMHDTQRIQRALEINLLTGKNLKDCFHKLNNFLAPDLDIYYFAMWQEDRAILHNNIKDRFYSMLQQGLVEEVERLLKQQIPLSMPAMRCVGYRQIIEYLQHKISKEEAYQKAIIATRQLAKRQFTWLRKWQTLVDLTLIQANLTQNLNQNNLDLIFKTLSL